MVKSRLCGVLIVAMIGITFGSSGASPLEAEEAKPPYDAKNVRHLEGFTGSAEARDLLMRQGFVVTDQQFRQIFEAYLSLDSHASLPKFITVDSAWHTYHVLLEEGVRQLEGGQAALLRRFSNRLYHVAMSHPQSDSVSRDLALFAAVGLALQEPDFVKQLPAEQKQIVEAVLATIRGKGSDESKLLFFDLPIRPDQFYPASFYADTPQSSNYFAARQWYATCAFRLKSDEETIRALHLALMIESDDELRRTYGQLTVPYDALLGLADDPGVEQYVQLVRNDSGGLPAPEKSPELLASFRRKAGSIPGPQINDQLLPRDAAHARAGESKGMRVLGPRRTPSAVLFQNTVDPEVAGRKFPSGLDVFAAGPLACAAGRRALKRAIPNAAARADIEKADCGPLPDSVHGEAMQLLTLLQEPVPTSAPSLFHTAAWHDKQLATALAAWAEERHTWALHAKVTVDYMGLQDKPPGYVEPYPEFYRRLGRLARRAAAIFGRSASESVDVVAVGRQWLKLEDRRAKNRIAGAKDWTDEFMEQLNKQRHAYQVFFRESGKQECSLSFGDMAQARDELHQSALRCAANKGVTETDRRRMSAFAGPPECEATELLPEFANLCDRLAGIAQKELDSKPLDGDDVRLIKDYGVKIAKFHFYGGNSYLTPRDDFPQVTPVFVSPQGNRAETLYAGVGRPEAIYVILLDGKQPVLHLGAVLSYREFRRPLAKPLDDVAWTSEVQAGASTAPLALADSFRRATSEEEVAAVIRAGKIYPGASLMPGRAITQALIDTMAKGESKDSKWLCRRLVQRATDEDVPQLIALIPKLSSDWATKIAVCLKDRNFQPYRDQLYTMLAHPQDYVADCAANLLAQHPEQIDVARLADNYLKQPPRSRRLFVYLAGRSKNEGPRREQFLLSCLDDTDPAILCEAAAAVGASGMKSPAIVARLIKGIDDENSCTAAGVTLALVKLDVKEAAPKMLARLTSEAPRRHPIETRGADHNAVSALTWCNGDPDVQVLYESTRFDSLAKELIKGLVALKYHAARDDLMKLVHSVAADKDVEDLGGDALTALLTMYPEKRERLLLHVVTAGKSSDGALFKAMDGIVALDKNILLQNPLYITALLSLVDEGESRGAGNFVGWHAASAIGQILADVDRHDPASVKLIELARTRLLKQTRGLRGNAVLDALLAIDRDVAGREALAIAVDRTAPKSIRKHALDLLGEIADPGHARALLPLLDEETYLTDGSTHFEWDRVCYAAATIIGELAIRIDPKTAEGAETRRLARVRLEKLLHGPHGVAAVRALQQLLDQRQQARFLLQTAGDRSLTVAARVEGLNRIANVNNRTLAGRLLPLLDDNAREEAEALSIAEHAANAISALCDKELSIHTAMTADQRADLVRQARKWANEK